MLIFNNKYWTFPGIKVIIVEISLLPASHCETATHGEETQLTHTLLHLTSSCLCVSSDQGLPAGDWLLQGVSVQTGRRLRQRCLRHGSQSPQVSPDTAVKSEISDWIFFNSSRSSSSSLPAPWWEWIFLRRLPASWWRRSLTTSPWLWRNLRGPSWPSSEGENFSFQQFIKVWTSELNRTCVKNYNPGSPVLTGP